MSRKKKYQTKTQRLIAQSDSMGFELSDIGDAAKKGLKTVERAVSGAVETIGESVDNVTGAVVPDFMQHWYKSATDPLAQFTKTVVTGPLRDFAKSVPGRIVLTAIATSFTGGLAPLLGPQLATIAWAMPGMLKGDDFTTAYLQELGSRVSQTMTIMGGEAGEQIAKLVGDQMKVAAEYLKNVPIDTAKAEDVAQKLGIRVDASQYAIDLARGVIPSAAHAIGSIWDPKTKFDPQTGRRIVSGLLDTGKINVRSNVSQMMNARRQMLTQQPTQKSQASQIMASQKTVAKIGHAKMTGADHPTDTSGASASGSKVPWMAGGAALGVAGAMAASLAAPLIAGAGILGAGLAYVLKK